MRETVTTPRPLLLLDIDGTLCPFLRASEPRPKHFIDLSPRLLCDQRMSTWLRSLNKHFEFVWASLRMDCNQVVGPLLGIPSLPAIPFNRVTVDVTGMRAEKLMDVAFWLEDHGHADRPMAWIDDDLGDRDLAWGRERDAMVPTLLRRCKQAEGITPEHIDELIAFANDPRTCSALRA